MNKPSFLAVAASVAVLLVLAVPPGCNRGNAPSKSPAAITGAEPGVWTQDADAAFALAAEKGLPILMNFTGSDWCPWCILMEKQVFSTRKWATWAKEHVVQVFIDFPEDKTRVPLAYVARNQRMAQEYGIEGFPTYVVLAADGKTRLGELGASRSATPRQFIADFEKLVAGAAKE